MTDVQSEKPTAPSSPSKHYALEWHLAELLFAMLPFVVLMLVFLFQNKPLSGYIMAPEWAFASSVLFGQTVVKLVHGSTIAGSRVIAERVGLIAALIIVFGLVPSMVVLAIVLLAPMSPLWLGVAQIGLAMAAAVIFVVVGTAAQEAAEEAKTQL